MNFKSISNIFDNVNIDIFLALTYEFDDAALIDICLKNSNSLKSDFIRPIVFFDARKTKEFYNAPPNYEMIPYQKKGGKHHSKAYLFTSDREVHLILGSLNLTKFGLLLNKEVFKHFIWDSKNHDDLNVLISFLSLLKSYYQNKNSENLERCLSEVHSLLDDFSDQENIQKSNYYLLHSGYSDTETGLSQLKDLWTKGPSGTSEFDAVKPDYGVVVSPFFDLTTDNLCKNLHHKNLLPSNLSIVTACNNSILLPITKDYVNNTDSVDINVYESSNIVNHETEEWVLTEEQCRSSGIPLKEKNEFRRLLHSKILILSKDNNSLVYFGSANFTKNAWDGRNCELGVAQWIPCSYKTIFEIIRKIYLTPNKPVEDKKLFDELKVDDTGDNSGAYKFYPEFIKSIKLVEIAEGEVQFVIDCDTEEQSKILDYKISWGDDIIVFEDRISQKFLLLDCLNIFLKRTLCFKPLEIDIGFFIPYLFDKGVIQTASYLTYGNSNQFIEALLYENNIIYESELNNQATSSGVTIEENSSTDINREDNATIRMQRFISLLPGLEKKLSEIYDHEKNNHQFNISVNNLIDFIERDHSNDSKAASIIFKIGEIRLILKSILKPKDQNLLNDLTEKIHCYADKTESKMLKEYVAYVTDQK